MRLLELFKRVEVREGALHRAGMDEIPVTVRDTIIESLDEVYTMMEVVSQMEGWDEFFEEMRGAWVGGLADFGNPDAASSIRTHPEYKQYYQQLKKAVEKYVGNPFTAYRLMSRVQIEEWKSGADMSAVAISLDKRVAVAFRKFAANKGRDDLILVQLSVPVEAVIMLGHRGEQELVIDPNHISAHQIQLRLRPNESVKGHSQYLSESYQKYEGQKITKNNRPMIITKALYSVDGVPFFQARYTDVPEGSMNSISSVKFDWVKDQLTEAIDPQQLVNVNTSEFRSWFGNSKAVDSNGSPIVFFRGTNRIPKAEKFVSKHSSPSFVASSDIASIYSASFDRNTLFSMPSFKPGSTVSPVFLSIKNPVDLRGTELINFEDELFSLMGSDWTNETDLANVVLILNALRNFDESGRAFEYTLGTGLIGRMDWDEVIDGLEEALNRPDGDIKWDIVTNLLSGVEVDVYAVVDTQGFRKWAIMKGFDGVVHDDVFAQGAKYAQSLIGREPNGLDKDLMHITWRPFNAIQVKSIFNSGSWSSELGSSMSEASMEFIRNLEKAPNMGNRFGQDIEPAGKYMIERPGRYKDTVGFETGVVDFKNPLVINWGEGYGEKNNWKVVLNNRYGGKTGKALSKAIIKDGYDGIITMENGHTSEIVDLTMFRESIDIITLYRGINAYQNGGNFYTTDKEWARQFTQSGLDSEIKKFEMNGGRIYRADPLPVATEHDFDEVMIIALSQGKHAIWVDEGRGQPDSVFLIPMAFRRKVKSIR